MDKRTMDIAIQGSLDGKQKRERVFYTDDIGWAFRSYLSLDGYVDEATATRRYANGNRCTVEYVAVRGRLGSGQCN